MAYKNSEGYNDPTAGKAIEKAAADERRVRALLLLLRKAIDLLAAGAGFEVVGLVVFRDLQDGRQYRLGGKRNG